MVEQQGATTPPDAALVAAMAAGDESALARLYDRYGRTAYSIAYAILGNGADAEEAVADAFVQAWAQAATFDARRASVAAWLCLLTRSRALDRLRARRRRTRTLELAASKADDGMALPLAIPEPAPDRMAERGEARELVLRAMAELPEPQRRVLELAYFGGLTQSEIAEELGEPLGTVKTRTRAALEKLRGALAAYPGS
ncbi:MAG TPA: sigma-70 family RNA polymerase sigma factor [Longimicrobiales bacterium]|nr:sigma-70 family RNA polymerase sigma factor [Longimicrobiales bacterium]